MKKFYAMLIIFVLLLTACGGNTNTGGEGKEGGVKQARILMVPSGNDYLIASGLAQMAKEQGSKINYTISDAGGNMGQIRSVMQGKADLANIVGSNGTFAYNGTHTFDGEQYEGLRGVVAVPAPIVQFIVKSDSGINSLSDFKNNARIVTFEGTAHMVVNAIMERAGKKLDVDYKLQTLPGPEQIDALKDGTADALVTWSTVPSPGYTSLDQTTSIKILPIEKDILEDIHREYDPGAEFYTVQKDVYSGQTEEALTSMSTRFYVTNAEVDDEIIYEFTKFLIENAEELAKYHPSASEISLENAVGPISIPLHPGAIKYYQEKGIDIPEDKMPSEMK